MIVRPESARDVAAIGDVELAAFRDHPYSRQTEHLIVEALRAAGALAVSLVAEVDGEVVGHVAFSPGGIGESVSGWYVLGPVAVLPAYQGEGIGRALVAAGLEALRSRGARGCVLVGDPAFYTRFGFASYPGVTWPGVPQENVMCISFVGEPPAGAVSYHEAFHAGT